MRAALTDDQDDDQPSSPISITSGRPAPASGALRVEAAPATDTQALSRDAAVAQTLRDAGLPINADDALGTCTLSDGTTLTLRELDGEDETVMEGFLDHYGVKPDGAGQSTAVRFSALMSISHVDGKEQAPVRHVQQLQRLLKYGRRDIGRIIAAFLRYNASNAEGTGTFR